jgi:hypothetical protein
MADSLTKNVEDKLYTATDYVASANLLTGVVSDLVAQGNLALAATVMESVNLLLTKANENIQQMSKLV